MPNSPNARTKVVSLVATPNSAPPRAASNLSDLAYERIEEMLVKCVLAPGQFLAMRELQVLVGLGRTPVHQAVSRLASDTLVQVTPRHGIRITPIDLTRDRLLLRLRREMERFVIRLATERSGSSERNRMQHVKRQLMDRQTSMTIEQFNVIDRLIDKLFIAAAMEPFVEATLRPLHTIFRRIGWIYHMHAGKQVNLSGTIDGHIAIINAVALGNVEDAIAASDRLMDFVDGMFEVLEHDVDPHLLDCSLQLDEKA